MVVTRCADHAIPLYPQNFALTSLTSNGRPVGMVRYRTRNHAVYLRKVNRKGGLYSAVTVTKIAICEPLYRVKTKDEVMISVANMGRETGFANRKQLLRKPAHRKNKQA
jgi:hypothetical protein